MDLFHLGFVIFVNLLNFNNVRMGRQFLVAALGFNLTILHYDHLVGLVDEFDRIVGDNFRPMSASFPESPPTFIPRLPRILSRQRGAVVAFGRLLRHSRSHVLGDIENLFRIDRNMPFPVM